MAAGIDVFREHFRDYPDQYVLIGGMACDLLLTDADIPFRATKDLDIVLIVEALTPAFAEHFWHFINNGGYHARLRSSGKPEFYRFVEPGAAGYPYMIEIFARPGNHVSVSYEGHLAPLPLGEELSSLSAILLNDAYYNFILEGRTMKDDLSVVDAAHLIPMKMKAWIDLSAQKEAGVHVNSRDIRKHIRDVFHLFALIHDDAIIDTPNEVYQDIQFFLASAETDSFDPTQIGLAPSKAETLSVLRDIYRPAPV